MDAPLIDKIRERLQHSVTFAELCQIDGFMGAPGWEIHDDKNIIIWAGISNEGFQAMRQLLDTGECYYEPCSTFLYHYDGRKLDLPIAAGLGPFNEPHWRPAVLKLRPAPATLPPCDESLVPEINDLGDAIVAGREAYREAHPKNRRSKNSLCLRHIDALLTALRAQDLGHLITFAPFCDATKMPKNDPRTAEEFGRCVYARAGLNLIVRAAMQKGPGILQEPGCPICNFLSEADARALLLKTAWQMRKDAEHAGVL